MSVSFECVQQGEIVQALLREGRGKQEKEEETNTKGMAVLPLC